MITVDGFFEGTNRNINWHNVDEEFNEFAIEQLNSAEGLIFGRVTYEMMASYWPSEMALKNDPIVASKMNSISKIVFSKTLGKAGWNNTRLVNENVGKEILNLKQQSGKDFYIFGSASLSSNLTQCGLIDEYRLIVNPIILGNGSPLFKGLDHAIKLKLLKARTFHNGNILLYYQPEQK
jgi:dihydrofolate reductase